MDTQLDLIAIGRVSVDLYGQQIGGRLEDVTTFARAVGGCPANVAIGAARLGLKSALISRVGEEAMGGFVREQLAREGVDTRGLVVDPQRLTSLVLLSVRDPQTFPLIFYRDNCADSALCEDDIQEDFVASAAAILVTGTHFSLPQGARAQRKAIELKKAHGGKVILDIDYRPNLWGLGGHAAGASRYARSARVTEVLAGVLPDCDLIVGTEEELHIAAGVENTLEAVRSIRAASSAVIVCKRGAQGCIVFAGRAPERLEDGLVAGGMEVEVYNVLGAGDAFLAGFLRGYLRDEPHETSARLGNACGAIAVSRLLCSSEFATLPELNYYLVHRSARRALRTDAQLNHLHWATTRPPVPRSLCVLDAAACLAAAPPARRAALEGVLAAALAQAARGREGCGLIGDAASGLVGDGAPLWQARSLAPEAAPDEPDGASLAGAAHRVARRLHRQSRVRAAARAPGERSRSRSCCGSLRRAVRSGASCSSSLPPVPPRTPRMRCRACTRSGSVPTGGCCRRCRMPGRAAPRSSPSTTSTAAACWSHSSRTRPRCCPSRRRARPCAALPPGVRYLPVSLRPGCRAKWPTQRRSRTSPRGSGPSRPSGPLPAMPRPHGPKGVRVDGWPADGGTGAGTRDGGAVDRGRG